jgi:hypothetical protein
MLKANSSTSKSSSPLETALGNVPAQFRGRLVKTYLDIKRRLAEANYESLGLAAGKFCEIVLRLLQHEILKAHTPFGQKIPDFSVECRKLIESPKTAGEESLRVVMPRALVFIYTLRNKRGIGHVGGDIDANRIDAMTIARSCDWVTCELIRVYHTFSLEDAQDLVDSLAQRNVPEVWHVAGRKRILRDGLDFKQQVLLLCYQEPGSAVLSEDLFSWVEYSDYSMFKRSVLTPLHKGRLVEYDRDSEAVTISPLGIKAVEEKILRKDTS